MIINKRKRVESGYSPTLSFLIDSSSGDNVTWKYIDSLEDFYINYNSSAYSPSYELAYQLLNLGYKLVLKNKNSDVLIKNLRIFDNGVYTYINKEKDYNLNLKVNEELQITDLLSFDLTLLQPIQDQDYIMINTGVYNTLLWFNLSNRPSYEVPIPSDEYSRLIQLFDNSPENLINTLIGMNFKVEYFEKLKVIRAYSFIKLNMVYNYSVNTFSLDYTNKNGSYDAVAYYYDAIKLLDVYSLIPSSVDDIIIDIKYNGVLYTVNIFKYSNNVVIYSEYYTASKFEEAVTQINLNSKLVNIIVYHPLTSEHESILLGSHTLSRTPESINKNFDVNFVDLFDNYSIDIFLDLFNTLGIPENSDYYIWTTNLNNTQSNAVFFENNDILLNTKDRVSIFFLFLYNYYKNKSFVGVIDLKILLTNYDASSERSNNNINKIMFSGTEYYIDKCRIKNQELSVAIIPVLLTNYIKRNYHYQMSQEDFSQMLREGHQYMNQYIMKDPPEIINYDSKSLGKLSIHVQLKLNIETMEIVKDIELNIYY